MIKKQEETMDTYDFSELESKFEDTVKKMKEPRFTSHEFLLKLSQANQIEYIKALHNYTVNGNQTPFRTVHGMLMKKLKERTDLVKCISVDCKDLDIFGDTVNNALWEKV